MNRSIPFILVAVAVLLSNATWGQSVPVQQLQAAAQQIHGQFSTQAQISDHGHAQNPDHAQGVRTELRTVQRQVEVYNPLTGHYETRIVEETVTVPIGGGAGGHGGNVTFLATIVNGRNEVLTVNVDGQQRKLNPGLSWQVRVSDGQVFSYHGEPRTISPGVMVGGATASARFSTNQATYNIGGGVGPVPIPGSPFIATFVNNGSQWAQVSVGNQTQKLNPGQSWQVSVTEGQTYSQSGPGRQWQNPDGSFSAVGGALAQGALSASQKVIYLGGGGGGPGPNPGGIFLATFVNNGNQWVNVSAGGQQRRLNRGQSWQVSVTEGQTFSYHGPARQRQNPDGSISAVGGALAQGTLSASQKVIYLGGGGGGGAGHVNSAFQVTIVNRNQNGVTVQVGSNSRKLNSGQSWQVSAKEGQQYSVAGDPRQISPGRWIGGGTYTGTFTSNKKVVNLGGGTGSGGNAGGGPIPIPVPGQQNPLTNGAFQVTFTNNASGPVTLTLRDTQQNVVTTRALQVGQSFSAQAKFGYTYHQDGPNVNSAFGGSSASASGGISPSSPNIILTSPR